MKIDIYSGFLGAGKTTLIKKMISEAYCGEKLMLIENEFGQIGIDGGFLKESGINITEMNSGCICCSLVGDFSKALKEAIQTYHPDRIIIEPSGVGKLSDVVKATSEVVSEDVLLNGLTTVVDVNRCKMYMKNFGEFFADQIKEAKCIILSHTRNATDEKISECVSLLRKNNTVASIITTDWNDLDGSQILSAIEHTNTVHTAIESLIHDHQECHHNHSEECECYEHHHHDHHDHDDDCECHKHHKHHHGEDCDCHEHHHHEHHHHHHHEEECHCHEHHDHHHADEVFESWGCEITKKFSEENIQNILSSLTHEEAYGLVLRAKGIVPSCDGEWIYFDYIPNNIDIRRGSPDVIGKICVIGSEISADALSKLFDV